MLSQHYIFYLLNLTLGIFDNVLPNIPPDKTVLCLRSEKQLQHIRNLSLVAIKSSWFTYIIIKLCFYLISAWVFVFLDLRLWPRIQFVFDALSPNFYLRNWP